VFERRAISDAHDCSDRILFAARTSSLAHRLVH
jgi:hypothetical protein